MAKALVAQLSAIRRQQAEHEGWFAHFQAQDTWSNARRDAELGDFFFDVDQLRGRLTRLENLKKSALEMFSIRAV